MVLTETGLAKVFQRIKSFIASQLNSKASAIHTHTKSEITDFPTNYVTTNTTQTIGGLKSFYDVGRYYIDVGTKSTNFLNFKVLNIELDSETNLPTKNYTFSQNITSTNPALYMGNYYSLTAQGLVGTDIRNYKYGSNKDYASISIRYALNDDGYIQVKCNSFVPNVNNATVLGSTAYKWADVNTNLINGINPGALSLPSISNTGANAWIVLDTTDWVKNTAVSFAQKYTPLADGWLNVRVDNATMLAIAVGGNYMHQMIRSETANSLALLMPVFKNTEVAIMVGGNENLAYNRVTFYYCQGNV